MRLMQVIKQAKKIFVCVFLSPIPEPAKRMCYVHQAQLPIWPGHVATQFTRGHHGYLAQRSTMFQPEAGANLRFSLVSPLARLLGAKADAGRRESMAWPSAPRFLRALWKCA